MRPARGSCRSGPPQARARCFRPPSRRRCVQACARSLQPGARAARKLLVGAACRPRRPFVPPSRARQSPPRSSRQPVYHSCARSTWPSHDASSAPSPAAGRAPRTQLSPRAAARRLAQPAASYPSSPPPPPFRPTADRPAAPAPRVRGVAPQPCPARHSTRLLARRECLQKKNCPPASSISKRFERSCRPRSIERELPTGRSAIWRLMRFLIQTVRPRSRAWTG